MEESQRALSLEDLNDFFTDIISRCRNSDPRPTFIVSLETWNRMKTKDLAGLIEALKESKV